MQIFTAETEINKKAKSTTYKVCWTHYILSYIYCNKVNNTIELICSKDVFLHWLPLLAVLKHNTEA